MSRMLIKNNKYLNYIVIAFITLNLLILVILDVSIVNIVGEIFQTSSLKDILNRIFYALLFLIVYKIYITYLHLQCLNKLNELQENQNKRGIDMSDFNNEAASIVQNIFGSEAVIDRFSASEKMKSASTVMSAMAKEKQGTFDLASVLLDNQFKLQNAKTQQDLREHIIDISNGVEVELKKSELKSLVQLTGQTEEDLLKNHPNLKIENQAEDRELTKVGILSDEDAQFLLENVVCHDNVTRNLKGLNIDTKNLTVAVFDTRVCKAIVKTLSNVKTHIKDQSSLIRCIELLHFIVARNEDLSDQQLKVFTDIVRSFYEQPVPAGELSGKGTKSPKTDQPQNDSDSNDGIKRYLSDEEESFVKVTIEGSRALKTECNTLKIVLDKPINFDAIGLVDLEKFAIIALQQKNQNKHVPKYAELEALLLKVIDQMKA